MNRKATSTNGRMRVVRKEDSLQQAMHRTVERLRNMTPDQLRQSLVTAGIVTSKGVLAKPYR